jgi:hypothetical protein
MRQLELQSEHKKVVDAEEQVNLAKGKVATADTHMMGFYKNFLGKLDDEPKTFAVQKE